jgi:hypothetical protein
MGKGVVHSALRTSRTGRGIEGENIRSGEDPGYRYESLPLSLRSTLTGSPSTVHGYEPESLTSGPRE